MVGPGAVEGPIQVSEDVCFEMFAAVAAVVLQELW